MSNQPDKPTLFDVMESDDHWADMMGEEYASICNAVKHLLNDLPGTFNHDSVSELRLSYHLLEVFVSKLDKLAKPYTEALAAEWAHDGHIDSLIQEAK